MYGGQPSISATSYKLHVVGSCTSFTLNKIGLRGDDVSVDNADVVGFGTCSSSRENRRRKEAKLKVLRSDDWRLGYGVYLIKARQNPKMATKIRKNQIITMSRLSVV